jgi:hypothetical protein
MSVQAVTVRCFGRLIYQRGSVTKEHGTLSLLHGLIADSQAKVSLASPCGGHDQLVLVASLEASAKGFMGGQLEWAWCREL